MTVIIRRALRSCDNCKHQSIWSDKTKICVLWLSDEGYDVKCSEIGNYCGVWATKKTKKVEKVENK